MMDFGKIWYHHGERIKSKKKKENKSATEKEIYIKVQKNILNETKHGKMLYNIMTHISETHKK